MTVRRLSVGVQHALPLETAGTMNSVDMRLV